MGFVKAVLLMTANVLCFNQVRINPRDGIRYVTSLCFIISGQVNLNYGIFCTDLSLELQGKNQPLAGFSSPSCCTALKGIRDQTYKSIWASNS